MQLIRGVRQHIAGSYELEAAPGDVFLSEVGVYAVQAETDNARLAQAA